MIPLATRLGDLAAVAEGPEHGGGVSAPGHGLRACQRSVGTRAVSSSTPLQYRDHVRPVNNV